MKIIVTTYPFDKKNNKLLKLLENFDVSFNELKKKYTQEEHQEVLKNTLPDIIIAGTEKYDSKTLDLCPNLKMISRVGIGVDSIDLKECKKRGIVVTNTPEAPSNAVAELTIAQMLNALRNITYEHKTWNRYIGRDLQECVVGVFGCNRIGKLVIEKLQGLKPQKIFVNDIDKSKLQNLPNCEPATKSQILTNSDIITLHIPLIEPVLYPTYDNHDFINFQDLQLMKKNAIIINTSRGGVINEADLYKWLTNNTEAKAVIDTFETEPYQGKFLQLNNVFLTPHLGSCTEKSHYNMETGAVKEILNFIKNKSFNNRVV